MNKPYEIGGIGLLCDGCGNVPMGTAPGGRGKEQPGLLPELLFCTPRTIFISSSSSWFSELKFGPFCTSPVILNKPSLDIEEDRVPSTPNKLLEELVVDEGDAFCLDEKLEEHLLPVLLTLSYALLLEYVCLLDS